MQGTPIQGQLRVGWSEDGAGSLSLLRPCKQAHQIAPHMHTEPHVVLVLRGRYEHVDGVSSGEPLLVFNPPRTAHRDRFAAGETLSGARFAVLAMSSTRWWQWQQQADLPHRVRVIGGQAVCSLAARWIEHLRAGPGVLDEVFADTLHLLQHRGDVVPCKAWLKRARNHLRQQVVDGSGRTLLSTLADDLGVHPVTLTRAFHREFGYTPTAYVQRLRIDRAAALLQQGTAVADVSAACGFFDQAHFSRQFKAVMTVTPKHWQRG